MVHESTPSRVSAMMIEPPKAAVSTISCENPKDTFTSLSASPRSRLNEESHMFPAILQYIEDIKEMHA